MRVGNVVVNMPGDRHSRVLASSDEEYAKDIESIGFADVRRPVDSLVATVDTSSCHMQVQPRLLVV